MEVILIRRWVYLFLFIFVAFFLPLGPVQSARQGGPVVITLRLNGALHPAMLEYLERAMRTAEQEDASVIILELDTPGGNIDLMNKLVVQIRGSKTPIVVYVSPRGAMAASAGTLITLAGHLSAMAPETTIGAASPVGGEGEEIGETMESKIKEITRATVRSLAANRPQEARDLAEDMIQNARAVSVDEALQIGLVDLKAESLDDLLRQLDGKQIQMGDQTIPLTTRNARVISINPTFLEELLMVLANPNIAFILLAIGVQAILIEISSPGGWIAGFIGVVCLLLAVYGLGLLPVNWFGILFLVVAFVLFILDINAPTHGALTVAGVGTFIVGALVLFNSPNVPAFQRVSIPLVIGTGVVLGLFFLVIMGLALRAQKIPARMGSTSLIGQVGLVNTPLSPNGTVQLGSELWSARLVNGGTPAHRGERVEVVGIDRLEIIVKKVA